MRRVDISSENRLSEAYAFEHSAAVLHGARERRLVHRLLYFWGALRGDAPLPSIDHIDVAAISEIWPKCFLLARQGGRDPYRFDHVGDELTADCGRDLVGLGAAAAPPRSILHHAVRALSMVVRERLPATVGGAIARSGKLVKFRSILLPFMGRTTGNLYVLGAASARRDPLRRGDPVEPVRCFRFDHGFWAPARLPGATGVANDG